ncbi:hypothetical protein ABPG75_006033 [Micractinium tetrahymenae]
MTKRRWLTPPASGDMHKPVEHSHVTVANAMGRWVATTEVQRCTTSSALPAKLRELFFEVITPQQQQMMGMQKWATLLDRACSSACSPALQLSTVCAVAVGQLVRNPCTTFLAAD